MKPPDPWDTRCTATSSRSASSSTASRQRGPSVLGISTRYCAPSGKRLSESGRSFRSPGGSPIECRKSRVSLTERAYRSGIRLLEEGLPALEERLQLVPRLSVGRDQLHVAPPVVGELALELGDGRLPFLDGALHPLELGRPFRLRLFRPGFFSGRFRSGL